MSLAGYATTVKVSGTAVAVTAEACTALGGDVFQVTNTARRIIDPTVPVLVYDGGVLLTTAMGEYPIAIDYLFGKVTLGAAAGGAITADFSYLPCNAVAEAKKMAFTRSRDLLDDTVFKTTAHRTRKSGLLDLKGAIDSLAFVGDDLDAGVGGTQSIKSFYDAGTPKLLEFRPGGSGDYFRAWVLFPDLGDDVSVDGLRETKIGFEGMAITGSGRTEGAACGWGT